jgi:hypothetical protein
MASSFQRRGHPAEETVKIYDSVFSFYDLGFVWVLDLVIWDLFGIWILEFGF